MGRPKLNFENMPGRFPEGTFARIDAVRREGENRSDFLKAAVEAEIKRREAAKQ
ncbi:YlcI/YnfO family protein [Brevundimonas nasdae]|uniref:YlcI/YnfO family protein n=1 Tax=Brevundimonas nasdae TaxID=172043 RepID=UPI00356B6ECF